MKHTLKTLLLSALLIGMPLWAGAQTTTTVAGGTTDSYLIPLQYLNASYAQWSQSIYPASYLTSLVGTQFTSFTYYVSYNGTAPDPGEYTISLGITTLSDLADGKDNTPTTQVFSGRPTIDGNALTFTFSQPFTYTGGNLLVYFDHQAGTTTTSESIPFNSISLSKASRSARNNASTTAYNSEGTYHDYLPTIAITATEAEPLTLEQSILYWVGEGSQKAYFVLDMGSESRAWGYRYDADDEPTALQMITAIDAADPRFAYTISWSTFEMSFHYADYPIHFTLEQYAFTVNDEEADAVDEFSDYDLADGMVVRVGAVGSAFNAPITPATVVETPEDATIAASDIVYWVGTGSNSAVLAINWAVPDTALAWGLRFDGDLTVAQALDYVAAADTRLSTNSYHSFINYTDGTVSLNGPADAPAGSWNTHQFVLDDNPNAGWSSPLSDGSFLKIGESFYGIGIDSTGSEYGWYPTRVVWPTKITPVSDPNAVEVAALDPSQVQYFVGEGEVTSYLVMHFNTEDEPVSMVWGYRHDGTATALNMLSDIDSADSRLSTIMVGMNLYNYYYTDDTYDLPYFFNPSTEQALPFFNGTALIYEGIESKVMGQGDRLEYIIADDFVETINFATTFVYVSDPNRPTDATIAQSDILYWVGTGSNSMVMAVSWADTALAWGYRFDGNATTQQVLEDIAAADPRFSFSHEGSFITDILFTANGVTHQLSSATSWWSSYTNGYEDMGASQSHANGDFLKWADDATGIVVDTTYNDWGVGYIKVWTRTVYPVSIPEGQAGPFCGIVGTEGCNAIAADSSAIVAWATGCTLTRGPQNIAIEGSPLVTYGSESDAIGSTSPLISSNLTCVSLGDGGSALLTFAQPIRNGEGPDLAVYENSFNDTFLELAFVEVSSDGERFVRFPATSLTQTETQVGGTGSIDATMINNLAGKFRNGYGTPFDLEELADSTGINIDSIVYVRIVDVVGSIDPLYATYDHLGNMVNDPWPTNSYGSGFDLSGVAVLHQREATQGIEIAEELSLEVYPNPATTTLNIVAPKATEATLYDLQGRTVRTLDLHEGRNTLMLEGLSRGVYVLRSSYSTTKVVVSSEM